MIKTTKNDISNLAAKIVRHLQEAGHESYFVGGCVRDFIRGVEPDDYDIVTSASLEQITKLFSQTVPVGAKFGVVLVIIAGHPFEVATFRSDDAYVDGRRPVSVRPATAQEDIFRRDFTINGLLLNPETQQIIDYVGGRADLEQKIIRTIGDPDTRFTEDYLRMLRAIRFAANLDMIIESKTWEAILRHKANISQISAERLREELSKMLTRGGADRGMEMMLHAGILQELLPEVALMSGVEQPPQFHPEGDVWRHTMLMLNLLPQEGEAGKNNSLAWGALLHDVGKPLTRTENESGVHFYGHVQSGEQIAAAIMQRLRFSRAESATVTDLIHNHMVFMNVRKMRPGRLKRFLRQPDFDLHLALHKLDCLASHGLLDNYEFCREQLANMKEEDLHPPRLLNGNDLLAMGFEQGKMIGEILAALEEEQLEGRINSREEAIQFVNTKLIITPAIK